MTEAVLELYGHSRRVGLIEWHPTTTNILFSAGYDYKVLIWNLNIAEPVKMIDCHSDVILCMSFNTNGSLLGTTCKDRKLRVIEPRSGKVLQEANCKNHRVNRVVFLGNIKRLLTTGVSRWNTRQIALWDQEDLSMPLIEEEIDGLSGLLFPFYDADTHMLYLAGKGDGNIRYYEISTEKPYLTYLMEFRSPAPQKGLGVMPKHGLDVSACEVFRFYKLVTLKGLIEPISMIVPRRSETYQEDIYPMTPGPEPALTPDEWLSGMNRDPILMSLKEGYKKESKVVFKPPIKEKKSVVVNGIDLLENVPPRTENELLRMFFRQQDEIRRLKVELSQKDIKIRQLQLELKNLRNSPQNNGL
ncbi:PREDICTED: coronin-2B isoform X2 [Thamnophis sirtalis]|uniref:Coronin n=3 Tax=Thamnophis TaxID=34999 RepID=A0A6I9Z112_9SAUR|nr:PREDICTED: coronin-2B isoform X2 [Thamnophis sirtalis]XP_013929761.1 PREDICTED: coronin-2B isoform X2 [Thamnophis sirtalis]